jgi:hypothetical protein
MRAKRPGANGNREKRLTGRNDPHSGGADANGLGDRKTIIIHTKLRHRYVVALMPIYIE